MSKTLAKINKYQPPLKLQLEEDIRALNYYRDELVEQINRFDSFKEKMNAIVEKGKQQEYLNEFRKMLSGSCITHHRTVTIIQCTNIITRGQCNFHQQCETRKTILRLIQL